MLSYVYVGTSDLARAIQFYQSVLGALGMKRCITGDAEWDKVAAGWGTYEDGGAQELAFWVGTPFDQGPATAGNGAMVAFRANTWKQVNDFHAAALANGGRSEGAPGLRPHYAPDFYAAYARDPDGNKIAALCRGVVGPLRPDPLWSAKDPIRPRKGGGPMGLWRALPEICQIRPSALRAREKAGTRRSQMLPLLFRGCRTTLAVCGR